jgi:5-methyltetrahydrofolate corrinoid/iron sulfur protein methyltransferase
MLLIADNLHIMSPVVAKALQARDPLPFKKIAEHCTKVNAYAMDINLGPLRHNVEEVITFVIEAVQDSFSGRLVLDSIQAEVIAAGIKICKQPPIINGFSLEEGKLQTILPLAAEYQADIVGFLIDEQGKIPSGTEERLAVASRLVAAAEERGVPSEKIIIDPVLVPLTWQDGTHYNRALIETIQILDQMFGQPIRTIAGLSNIGAGAPARVQRQTAEAAYIFMLAASHLDYILMNVAQESNLTALNLSQLLLAEKVFAWQEV